MMHSYSTLENEQFREIKSLNYQDFHVHDMCVCMGINIFVGTNNWNLLYLWGPTALVGTDLGPNEFEGFFETQIVVLVSGLQLGYGYV